MFIARELLSSFYLVTWGEIIFLSKLNLCAFSVMFQNLLIISGGGREG